MQRLCRLTAVFLTLILLCGCSLDGLRLKDREGTGTDSSVTTEGDSSEEESGLISSEDYTAGEIMDYFGEVAFGSEFGDSSGRVCRWEEPIKYTVTGSPRESDLELLSVLCDRLNEIEGFPGISYTDNAKKANYTVMFIPRSQIVEEFENATEACVGMSEFTWYTSSAEIFKARAAIDCDAESERESTVCEEFLQSLGLAMDSYAHPNSVFYQGVCNYSRPSELDYILVELLYSPALTTGMTKTEALRTAVELLRWK